MEWLFRHVTESPMDVEHAIKVNAALIMVLLGWCALLTLYSIFDSVYMY